MTAREATILSALRNLYEALSPYREQGFHGTTHCKFCGVWQGEWVQGDPRWIPSHTEKCPIGQAMQVLREAKENEQCTQ